MPALDVQKELSENTRGGLMSLYQPRHILTPYILVLGQDPLIPPALLQSEIPAVPPSRQLSTSTN